MGRYLFTLLHQLSLRTHKEKDKPESEREKDSEAETGEEINMSRLILCHISASF